MQIQVGAKDEEMSSIYSSADEKADISSHSSSLSWDEILCLHMVSVSQSCTKLWPPAELLPYGMLTSEMEGQNEWHKNTACQ